MVELRPRRAKAGPADATKVDETPKKPKTPKVSKRKATDDVAPTATKKAKSVDTPAKPVNVEEHVTKQVNPTPRAKKGKTPVKAKDSQVAAPGEPQETLGPKSSTKSKTPVQAKDVDATTSQDVAETLDPKSSKKTRTPAKSSDVDTVAPQEPSGTPAPKSAKRRKTTARIKVTETAVIQETIVEEADKTPGSRSKKNKTPDKAKVNETTVAQETVQEFEETPAFKSVKINKKRAKSVGTAPAATQDKTSASKTRKDKTPAKVQLAEESAPTDSDKKDKTLAKAKLVKETPSKTAAQPTSKTAGKTSAESKVQTARALTPLNTPKSAKKSGKKPELVEHTVSQEPDEASTSQDDELVVSDEDLDEQTKNLIKTIDVEEFEGAQSGSVLFEVGQDVGKIPEVSKKQQKKIQKKLAASSSIAKEETGVLYVGRLPHGFYEHEMRSYFSQFGPIRNLRVARNKQTGKAKHFAFVEFEEASTAEIVAKTMDNYLLFGHILKCSVVPVDQVHDELFKGANKRFKPVPWNRMEGKQMQRPLVEGKWSRKIAKENKRRAERAKKLKAMGYEYDAPEIMGVDAAKAIAAAAAETEDAVGQATEKSISKTIEPPPATEPAIVKGTQKEAEQEEAAVTPKPAKRGRGRPPKSAAAEAAPNKKVTGNPNVDSHH